MSKSKKESKDKLAYEMSKLHQDRISAIYEMLKLTTDFRLSQIILIKDYKSVTVYSVNESGEKRKFLSNSGLATLASVFGINVVCSVDVYGYVYMRFC